MKTIYVDISNILRFPFMTGIQRVVSEVVIRLIANQHDRNYELVLLYNDRDFNFRICDKNQFLAHFSFGHGKRNDCITSTAISLDHLVPSAFWLDLDATWAGTVPRSVLYPQLTKRNIQIGVYVYDVIVLTHPQYASAENLLRFPTYMGAVLDYADFIFTEAAATQDQIRKIAISVGCSRNIRYCIATPGANFTDQSKSEEEVSERVREIVRCGKILLTVSTLEARKNHKILLDAFDSDLSEMGYQMVFVGRYGWKVEELVHRIEEHPKNGTGLFHLQGINNAELHYLYRNAKFVLFPSYIEGYGLATVEALQYGVPTILSDIPIMREVGGGYCDYFDPDDPNALVDVIRRYEDRPELYEAKRKVLKSYIAPSWDTCVSSILDDILPSRGVVKQEHQLEQIVCLSARADDLLRSLPYVEKFMPFIKRLILLCPDSMAAEMEQRYTGKLAVTYITDSQLLCGHDLPEDHAVRNFFLRCLAMIRPELDEEFIMMDDDYRPMEKLDEDFFISDDRYQAFYFYDLDEWMKNVVKATSYDLQMLNTNRFLREYSYPNLQYASHMPQVIRKEWYVDMLREHPGLGETGCDEWSTYFNFAVKKHPESFDVRPYVTMSWPEMISSWDPMVIPRRFVFENFYDFLYEEGRPFSGMSTTLQEDTYLQNAKKSILSKNLLMYSAATRKQWRAFENKCNTSYGQFPSFVFCYGKSIEPEFLGLPPHLEMRNASTYSLHVSLIKQESGGEWRFSDDDIRIGYCWEGSEHFAEAENYTRSGHATIRIGTPQEGRMGLLKLLYSIEGGEFVPVAHLEAYFKK